MLTVISSRLIQTLLVLKISLQAQMRKESTESDRLPVYHKVCVMLCQAGDMSPAKQVTQQTTRQVCGMPDRGLPIC